MYSMSVIKDELRKLNTKMDEVLKKIEDKNVVVKEEKVEVVEKKK